MLNVHVSPVVGPANLGTCKDIKFQNDIEIIKGTIWYEDARIHGVFLEFSDGYVHPIGLTIGTALDVDFSASNSFIGFYGNANDSYIEALGFLTQDLACEGIPQTDNEGEGNSNENGALSLFGATCITVYTCTSTQYETVKQCDAACSTADTLSLSPWTPSVLTKAPT